MQLRAWMNLRGIAACLRIRRVATQKPKKMPTSIKNDWCVGFAAEHVWEWIVSSKFHLCRANELSLKTRAWSQIFKLCPSLPYLHPTDFASGGGPQFCRVLVVFDWLGYLWAVGGFNILRPEGMQETDHSYYLFCFYAIFDGFLLVHIHFKWQRATSTRNTLVTSTTSAFTAATQPPQSLSYQVSLPPLTIGFRFSSRIKPLLGQRQVDQVEHLWVQQFKIM